MSTKRVRKYPKESISLIEQNCGGEVPSSLSNSEFTSLIIRAQGGDIEAQNKIIESSVSIIASAASSNSGNGIDVDDLFQIGVIGCITAIHKFDSSHNTKWSTWAIYAWKVISTELQKEIRSNKDHSKNISLESKLCSDGIDISDEELLNILSLGFDDNPEEIVERAMINDILRKEISNLGFINEYTIKMYFGIDTDEATSKSELAKIIGISITSVTRRIEKSMILLRRHMKKYRLKN